MTNPKKHRKILWPQPLKYFRYQHFCCILAVLSISFWQLGVYSTQDFTWNQTLMMKKFVKNPNAYSNHQPQTDWGYTHWKWCLFSQQLYKTNLANNGGPTTLSLVKSLKWFYHSNTPHTLHVYLSCFVTTLYSKRSLGQLQKWSILYSRIGSTSVTCMRRRLWPDDWLWSSL